jgi:putative acetyltransferase
MVIREAAREDAAAVGRVVEAAFGRPAEAELVARLGESGAAVLSLLAEDRGEAVGHILFSRLLSPARCLALAPLSVVPGRQNQGIGSRLVRDGLARAGRDGWPAVFVLGEPGYYRRFGFRRETAARFETAYPKAYVLALELAPGTLAGQAGPLAYPPAFDAVD